MVHLDEKTHKYHKKFIVLIKDFPGVGRLGNVFPFVYKSKKYGVTVQIKEHHIGLDPSGENYYWKYIPHPSYIETDPEIKEIIGEEKEMQRLCSLIAPLHNKGKSAYQIAELIGIEPQKIKDVIYLRLTRYNYVYVIELEKKVMEHPEMIERNPDYIEGMECFYVGSTALYPEERYLQHKDNYHANYFTCHYGKSLAWKLFESFNPFETKSAAENMEEWLALQLREDGYAVWYGIHNRKSK